MAKQKPSYQKPEPRNAMKFAMFSFDLKIETQVELLGTIEERRVWADAYMASLAGPIPNPSTVVGDRHMLAANNALKAWRQRFQKVTFKSGSGFRFGDLPVEVRNFVKAGGLRAALTANQKVKP